MRLLLADDEKIMLENLKDILKDLCPKAEIYAFSWPADALDAARQQQMDIAFLDIEMGNMNGLQMAIELKKLNPDIHIIFVTGFSQYAVDAFQIHASGYLLKPVKTEDVARELTFLYAKKEPPSHIRVQMFGGFEIYVDGKPVKFGRSKSKELLAYLIDCRGASVTTAQAYSVLYGDEAHPVSGTSYFRNIIRELRISLKNAGIEKILKRDFNSLSIVPEALDCDYYHFLEGDPIAVNLYRNNYLPQYSWAEFHHGFSKYF